MKAEDNVAITRACYDAYVRKDRASIEKLLAEDFHFTSPLDNRLDRATYFRRCWPNSATAAGFDFINLVPDGDRVFVTYVGRSNDGHRFRNTEIVMIRGARSWRWRSISAGPFRMRRLPGALSTKASRRRTCRQTISRIQ